MYDGVMYTLGSRNGKVLQSKSLGQRIGYASLLPKQHLVVLDNISNGFDLWDLDVGTHLRTFPTGPPTRFLPRQVVFAERWKAIVAGSDHGAVYVFDRTTGTPLDVLRHPAKGLVQTVAAMDQDGYSVVACGSSGEQGVVTLWQSKKLFPDSTSLKSMWSLYHAMSFAVQLVMVLATISFVFQNMGFQHVGNVSVSEIRGTQDKGMEVVVQGQQGDDLPYTESAPYVRPRLRRPDPSEQDCPFLDSNLYQIPSPTLGTLLRKRRDTAGGNLNIGQSYYSP
ncbi:hypothetical protein GSI_07578 [Ganoderma sinense ZZ0214-1]|uniref:Uncharacterized protein n=1 Tax=Ganoderma sinense ZZ0214-1 TaxID=1077348 RepID=A0A2G8S9G2_9APHY|nr:hypothetical protein GSI_07578 [Ganoderma sinense ZZ0214-1]